MATSTVKAGTYVMGLYGSRWNMVPAEQDAAKSVIDYMENYFTTYAGYTCGDYYGYLTQKSIILWFASLFEQNYDHVAMFHHGHGGMNMTYKQHRDYFDDDGPEPLSNQIWDYEVGQKALKKHFFVIIWACRQGDHIGGQNGPLGVYGMPYAWHNPVDSSDCFIGFKDASMPLTQKSQHFPGITYANWFKTFIWYLTRQHCTIMQALDEASIHCFYIPYSQTELHNGFTAKWPNLREWRGQMVLYGNPGIRVY